MKYLDDIRAYEASGAADRHLEGLLAGLGMIVDQHGDPVAIDPDMEDENEED